MSKRAITPEAYARSFAMSGVLATGLSFVACGAATPRSDVVEQPPAHVDPRFAPAAAAAASAMTAALVRADDEAVALRGLPPDADWRTILDPQRSSPDSLSLGTTAGGRLINAVELPPDGDAHSIIDRLRKYKARFGTRELVELVQSAAQQVQLTHDGAPLRVGEMSKDGGGDLRWHRSHNSGRDVDLAFYVVDAKSGESVPAPRQLTFNAAGVPSGRKDLRFDVARNWRLVEALLAQQHVNVQWLFVSTPLRAILLDHAAQVGADPEVIRRAEDVLHQPEGASPHANHFHLRIGCSADDRVDGCLDDGPAWDWADWHHDALLSRAIAVSGAFESGDSTDKLRALQFLAETQSPFVADVAAVWGFWDADPAVRSEALKLVHAQKTWSANVLVQVEKLRMADQVSHSERAKLEDIAARVKKTDV